MATVGRPIVQGNRRARSGQWRASHTIQTTSSSTRTLKSRSAFRRSKVGLLHAPAPGKAPLDCGGGQEHHGDAEDAEQHRPQQEAELVAAVREEQVCLDQPAQNQPQHSGGRGQSSQLISMPTSPAATVTYIENRELSSAKPPNSTSRMIPGRINALRISVMRTIWLTSRKLSATLTTWEMITSQTKAKVRSRWVVSMSGPGTIPWIRKAPSKMAIVTLLGTPKATVVIRLPPSLAFIVAPGPITPRTSPFPNRLLSGALCTACAYANHCEMPPRPGMRPRKTPRRLQRTVRPQWTKVSLQPCQTPPTLPTRRSAMLFCLTHRSTSSPMPNSPTVTGTSLIPSHSSSWPKV